MEDDSRISAKSTEAAQSRLRAFTDEKCSIRIDFTVLGFCDLVELASGSRYFTLASNVERRRPFRHYDLQRGLDFILRARVRRIRSGVRSHDHVVGCADLPRGQDL